MKLSKSNTAVLLTTVEMLKIERDAERALADDANFVINLMMTSPHEDKYEEVARWQARYQEARQR